MGICRPSHAAFSRSTQNPQAFAKAPVGTRQKASPLCQLPEPDRIVVMIANQYAARRRVDVLHSSV